MTLHLKYFSANRVSTTDSQPCLSASFYCRILSRRRRFMSEEKQQDRSVEDPQETPRAVRRRLGILGWWCDCHILEEVYEHSDPMLGCSYATRCSLAMSVR